MRAFCLKIYKKLVHLNGDRATPLRELFESNNSYIVKRNVSELEAGPQANKKAILVFAPPPKGRG
jgi:hypothetical protein